MPATLGRTLLKGMSALAVALGRSGSLSRWYADDFIVGFQHENDARRFLDAMRERLGKFALSLHPEKTRLIEFGRFAAENRRRRGLGKPETFSFLGFTFICGRSKRGKFLIRRKSRSDRMPAKVQEIKMELQRRIHQPIPEQGKWLRQVMAGYFNYHAVPTNSRSLDRFRHRIIVHWRRVLDCNNDVETDEETGQRLAPQTANPHNRRVDAVELDRLDLPFTTLVLPGRNLAQFDSPQDRGLVQAGCRCGRCEGIGHVLPIVALTGVRNACARMVATGLSGMVATGLSGPVLERRAPPCGRLAR
jgi:hypothetical protein